MEEQYVTQLQQLTLINDFGSTKKGSNYSKKPAEILSLFVARGNCEYHVEYMWN